MASHAVDAAGGAPRRVDGMRCHYSIPRYAFQKATEVISGRAAE